MAEFFNKIAEEVEKASEELYALFTGESASGGGGGGSNANFDATDGDSGSFPHEFDLDDMNLDGMSEEQIQEMLAEDLMKNNPLQDLADGVTRNIMAGQSQPQNAMEHLEAFGSAINWSEKFILGLVAFQVVMFFSCLHFSRKDRGLAPRVTLLVIIFIVVRSAEWLNAQGEEHWESFATQDYFDKRGIFVGIMLSGPMLLDSLMMLLLFMREAASLLVQVKRTEIQRKKQKNDGKATGGKKKITGKRAKTKKQD